MAMASAHHEAAATLLDQLLADGQLTDPQRAEALLLSGLAQEGLNHHRDAFEAAAQGKRLQRAAYSPMAQAREGEVAKLGRIASWLATSPRLARSRGPTPTSDTTPHIFLLGFPRSGTTLLEQVLAAHPRISTLEEEATLATAYQAFLSNEEACASLTQLGDDEAAAWADHYWKAVHAHGIKTAGRVFVDKQPAGTLNLPIIARLFPHAKILFAIRDPRDVVLSCFRQAFRMNAMSYAFTDLVETARCYDACMTLAAEARARLQLDWLDLRHEALVDDFVAEVDRVVRFLELEADPAMADFARIAATRTIRTPSAAQVRAGLNRKGLGRWRQYRHELAQVLPMLAPWVERFGYTP